MPFLSFFPSGRRMCLGRAVIVFRLRSYCVTSEIDSLMRMLCSDSEGHDYSNLRAILPGLVGRGQILFPVSGFYHIVERLVGSKIQISSFKLPGYMG